MLIALLACSKPAEESPQDLDTLCHDLFRQFASDEAAATAASLRAWIAGVIDDPEEGYRLTDLGDGDVADVSFADALVLDRTHGAAVIRKTLGSMDAHSAVVPESDQSFADGTYELWERTITAGNAEDYLAGGELETDNVIEKSAPLGVLLPYPMKKDYRWLDDGETQIFRSVIYEEGWDDDGANGVVGGFTIEAWFPDDDGGVSWFNASWEQVETSLGDLATEDFLVNEIIDGTHDYMEGTEAHVLGE